MFGLLCHDLGKPATTREADGTILCHGHETAGLAPTESFLQRLKASKDLTAAVKALVRHHLAPSQLVRNKAGPGAYRRLARKLAAAKINLNLLERAARADHLGRTTETALRGVFPAGDAFQDLARTHSVAVGPTPDAVLGRHLIEAGYTPGREFGLILTRCREIQDETGYQEPEKILRLALDEPPKKQ
jgi:tRNA nucleotidyltransferase (CCA-adding enzyme)